MESEGIAVGDRVRWTTGRHEGQEGQVIGMSDLVQGRQVVLIQTDGGRRLVALPKELEKIARLVH